MINSTRLDTYFEVSDLLDGQADPREEFTGVLSIERYDGGHDRFDVEADLYYFNGCYWLMVRFQEYPGADSQFYRIETSDYKQAKQEAEFIFGEQIADTYYQ